MYACPHIPAPTLNSVNAGCGWASLSIRLKLKNQRKITSPQKMVLEWLDSTPFYPLLNFRATRSTQSIPKLVYVSFHSPSIVIKGK